MEVLLDERGLSGSAELFFVGSCFSEKKGNQIGTRSRESCSLRLVGDQSGLKLGFYLLFSEQTALAKRSSVYERHANGQSPRLSTPVLA